MKLVQVLIPTKTRKQQLVLLNMLENYEEEIMSIEFVEKLIEIE